MTDRTAVPAATTLAGLAAEARPIALAAAPLAATGLGTLRRIVRRWIAGQRA